MPATETSSKNRFRFDTRDLADRVAELITAETGYEHQPLTLTDVGDLEREMTHQYVIREVVGRGRDRFGDYVTTEDVQELAAHGVLIPIELEVKTAMRKLELEADSRWIDQEVELDLISRIERLRKLLIAG